jgi:hypothetical protein
MMGADMDNYALCEALLKAETETEVEAALLKAGYMDDDPSIWQPFGGFGMNLNQINNQQSDPTAALVEKLINSIDAVLMGECYKAGIDPKSPQAPQTMAAAVDKLFRVKDGRLEYLTARERTALADRVHFVATGSKKEPCYLVIDRGEGQTPAMFKDTFLSLTRQNKDDIPFVQGRFNCGGTGVLPFCGEHKYQLIISRRQPSCPVIAGDSTKDLWGFTLVRRQRAAQGRKSGMYVFLAPAGEILTLRQDALKVLPGQSGKNKPAPAYALDLSYGTCIKLYAYRWKRKTLLTTDGRYELEKFLHSLPLPLRVSETREGYRANYYSTTLSGILAHINEEGNEEHDTNSKFEKGFEPAYGELNLTGIGRLPFRLFLLKEKQDKKDDNYHFPHGVFFTLNGQVHGDLPANFIATSLKFDTLSDTLLVSVDCTEMEPGAREDFLMASRDRVRRNEVYDDIFRMLREELREHPGLRDHNAQRNRRRLDETLSKAENSGEYFSELLKSDPTIASALGLGNSVVSTAVPSKEMSPFAGKQFPTFFRLMKEPKEGLVKPCPLNRTARVEFETDAEDGYFSRSISPGSVTFHPPDLCVSSHLWAGKFTCKFQLPYDAGVGDIVEVSATVSDITRETKRQPFTAKFSLKGEKELKDTSPPGGPRSASRQPKDNGNQSALVLAMPDIREVRRDKWEDPQFKFNKYSAVKILNADESGGYIFFVNMDNRFLVDAVLKSKNDEGVLVKHWFKYGIVLSALGIIKEIDRKSRKTNDEEEEDEADALDLSKIGEICAGLARVVVPMIRALHKGPSVLETVSQAAA